ncbi:unnamed protein product [Didymodactylos carnosus]|nr:unnamed protein product [Didymodactylos carnosus]CAF4640070.1 unnamed protein product [Didymodactylos carnosus]
MLGHGIYFARSLHSTEGKARAHGAYICAEVIMDMGKGVKYVTVETRNEVSNTDEWHKEYDSVYYRHPDNNYDEFCVKSVEQILKWVIVVEPDFDKRPEEFGLTTEFDGTRCCCI